MGCKRRKKRIPYAAGPKGSAAIFYSTKIPIYTNDKTKSKKINEKCAAEIQRSRLFFVTKGHYKDFYHSRAPPSCINSTNQNLKQGDHTMIITYEFADGTIAKVEVEDKLGLFILESRKAEENLSRKERYHGFSIEGCLYEGIELSTDESPEKILHREIDKTRLEERFDEAVKSLSETQRRRLVLFIKGLSTRDIGLIEGVSSHSVAKSIWGARKNFLKIFPERGVTKRG